MRTETKSLFEEIEELLPKARFRNDFVARARLSEEVARLDDALCHATVRDEDYKRIMIVCVQAIFSRRSNHGEANQEAVPIPGFVGKEGC